MQGKQLENMLSSFFFEHGYVTYLLLLDMLEEAEEYAKCQSIINVLQEKSEKYGIQIPTKLDRNIESQFYPTASKITGKDGNMAAKSTLEQAEKLFNFINK